MPMRLVTQQRQRLVMTPLLQLAIQLLQLSTLELEQVVRKELEENPLLEELPEEKQEVDGEAATATAADGTELAPAPAPPEPQSKETASVDGERADDLPFDLTSCPRRSARTCPSRTSGARPPRSPSTSRSSCGWPRMIRMVALGEAIIGKLDEDGCLHRRRRARSRVRGDRGEAV
jgi:hypothetical protein